MPSQRSRALPASASLRGGSRSAQATMSNESNARAFSAYCRLITPQPTIPIRAAPITRPRRRRASGRRRSGRPRRGRPSTSSCSTSSQSTPAATAAGATTSYPTAPSPTGQYAGSSLGRKSLMCTIGERAPARVTSVAGSKPANHAQPRSSSRNSSGISASSCSSSGGSPSKVPQLAVVVVEARCNPQGRRGRSSHGEPDQRGFRGRGRWGDRADDEPGESRAPALSPRAPPNRLRPHRAGHAGRRRKGVTVEPAATPPPVPWRSKTSTPP